MKSRAALLAAATVIAASLIAPEAALAQAGSGRLPLIRDAEIEHTIRAYTAPIWQAAGMSSAKIQVALLNDNRINAFVAGGRYIFVNTGLLSRAEHAGQVIGVLAHETGHIAGGHLVRLQRELQDAQIKQIIATILAAGAGIASRNPGVAIAGMGLGARLTEGTFYQFARTQESAADAFAMSTLDRMGVSARGLFEFLQILGEQEMLYPRLQDPYMRTHPMTRERADEVRRHMERSPHTNKQLPKALDVMHVRMRAKLIGFLTPPEQVIQRYRGKESTLEARYALAVAYHQDARLERALQFIDSLIKEFPNDPYFWELKGQILFESGRNSVPEAVAAYERAVKLAPNEALIRIGLAQAQLETGDQRLEQAALGHLKTAMRYDDTYPLAWRLLSVAYGKTGDVGNAALANAEYAYLMGDMQTLRASVAIAERHVKAGTPAWVRLQDLKAQIKEIRDERRR